jgi:hypothetical protein
MPRWMVSLAFNRLVVLALVVYLIRAYGPATSQAEGALTERFSRFSPFEAIERALR